MSIGMTWEAVNYGDRTAFDDFEKAYEYRRVQENQLLHLQGLYDHIAVSCALSAAFAEKGKKGTPYPQHPIPITETERKEEKRRKIIHTLEVVRNRKRTRSDNNGARNS